MSSSVGVPQRLVLDPVESAALGAKMFAPNRWVIRSFVALVVVFSAFEIFNGSVLVGRHEPVGWALVGAWIFFLVVTLVSLRPRSFESTATMVAFTESGIEIVRGSDARAERCVPFAQIRSVQRSPDALLIVVRSGIRFSFVLIPTSATADGGAELMRFFADRLIGKHQLRRSIGATIIVNSISR